MGSLCHRVVEDPGHREIGGFFILSFSNDATNLLKKNKNDVMIPTKIHKYEINSHMWIWRGLHVGQIGRTRIANLWVADGYPQGL